MKKSHLKILAVLVSLCIAFSYAKAQKDLSASDPVLKKQQLELHDYIYGSGNVVDPAMEKMLVKSFIVMHPDYYISLVKFKEMITTQQVDHAERRFESFSASLRQSTLGKEVEELIKKLQQLQPGSKAPEITAMTPDNKPFRLSDLKGKYVLVDFWASWCTPCRGESPNLVKAYERFKNRNFEIVSFSLDKNPEAWKQAAKQDHYTWPQVSDLKEYQSETVKNYMVVYVPKSFLLDPDGNIIAMDLRGDMLEKQLEKIFP